MIIALPLHIVAMIVWLGGLVAVVLLAYEIAPESRALWWFRSLKRLFLFATPALATVLATGIALVQLRFGGFSKLPPLHRWNMLLGAPAIALYLQTYVVSWRSLRRAVAANDWNRANRDASAVHVRFGFIVALGVAAAVVSSVGRVTGL